jgi:hypothetical protein
LLFSELPITVDRIFTRLVVFVVVVVVVDVVDDGKA